MTLQLVPPIMTLEIVDTKGFIPPNEGFTLPVKMGLAEIRTHYNINVSVL
jgi:hypothetical protein